MSTMILCPCGAYHPKGFLCPKMSHDAPERVTRRSLFSVQGMDCPVEEKMIRDKLADLPGIFSLSCNIMERRVLIQHDPAILKTLVKAMESLNLDARLLEKEDDNADQTKVSTIEWGKLLFAGICAAFSEVAEFLHSWEPLMLTLTDFHIQIGRLSLFDHTLDLSFLAYYPLGDFCSFLFAILAITIGGLKTYKKGWLALINKNLNINALMSVAVTGSVLIGQYPESAMVMVLFNLSEALESKALDRTRNAIKELLAIAPETATVLQKDGIWTEKSLCDISVGSHVRVRPGEKIALDGVIVLGESTINQAPITGESLPVEKKIGDFVFAGTINESGSFEFKVTAEAHNTTLARIIHSVEEAQNTRAPVQRFVDTFATYYTPFIFLLAILTAIFSPILFAHDWIESIYTGLVILVISCPCALVISVPVSIMSGMAAATKSGILIKGGIFLERGRLIKYLALDKTGTLTRGLPCQTDFIPLTSRNNLQSLAASLAVRSDHPVSKALVDSAQNMPLFEVSDFAAVPGQGIVGVINGETWFLGNARMLENVKKNTAEIEKIRVNLEKQGKSVVILIGYQGAEAIFAVADTLKKSTIKAIEELKRLGVKTIMLTGDNVNTAAVISRQAGVDAYKGNLLPEDKLHAIEELTNQGITAMAGDGINDAPALAKADIGFAMAGAGTDTAIETADIALMDDDLKKIPRFIRLSKATYAIVMENICITLAIKATFLVLTFLGLATMWMAVFADVGTSLIVVMNGLRATRK